LEKPSLLTGAGEAVVDSAKELVLEFCPDLFYKNKYKFHEI
jgi:hypothetical protein